MCDPLKWYDHNATDNPPWIKALVEVRRLAPREGWRYHHVQAIIYPLCWSEIQAARSSRATG